ncbi:DNA polymerase II subunit B3-1 [Linum perenne]
MASTKIPKKEEDKKKKNNDKRSQKNGKALGIIKSPAKGKKSPVAPKPKPKPKPKSAQKKATPVKTPSKSKTPTKPKREENSAKKKKPEPEELVVPSSSCESEREGGEHGYEGKTPSKNSKSYKTEVDKKKKMKVKDETEADEDGGEGDDGTMCRFPMARIRRIMTSEAPNLHPGLEGQDVVFLVNRATEMFLEKFSEEGHRSAIDDRKKSLDYKHLATVVSQSKRFDFLSDFVPLKVKAVDALEARKSGEK